MPSPSGPPAEDYVLILRQKKTYTFQYGKKVRSIADFLIIGDPGVIRTRDLRIRSPALYPAELRSHFFN